MGDSNSTNVTHLMVFSKKLIKLRGHLVKRMGVGDNVTMMKVAVLLLMMVMLVMMMKTAIMRMICDYDDYQEDDEVNNGVI